MTTNRHSHLPRDGAFEFSSITVCLNLKAFLSGDVVDAAKRLIGCRLIRSMPDMTEKCVRIIETEAYHQSEPGSHSFRGPTSRSKTMFGRAGLAYVYLIYGMYHCFNIVAGIDGEGSAVLIRAVEDCRSRNMPDEKPDRSLAGPGKLCKKLDITRELDGLDLLDNENGKLVLCPRLSGDIPVIISSTRIGLSKALDLPWRFCEQGNPRVSKKS